MSQEVNSALEYARATGGYAWWYVEAHDTVSHRYGLTLIFFAGSVFSPAYAERLYRGERASGLDHPAVNVVLYERPRGAEFPTSRRLWVMNEYAPAALHLQAHRLSVAKSSLEYGEDGTTRIELSEETTRFFGKPGPRLTASLRITANKTSRLYVDPVELGRGRKGERHFWQPLIAAATAEVELHCGDLSLRFRGVAYCDRNFGSGRLENAFSHWSWAHGVADTARGEKAESPALVLYRAERLDGSVTGLSLRHEGAETVLQKGSGVAWVPPRRSRDFLWLRVPKNFTVESSACERLTGGRLEDAPFYARYVARLSDAYGSYLGVGEFLDLERFRFRPVQHLLTYKTRVVPR